MCQNKFRKEGKRATEKHCLHKYDHWKVPLFKFSNNFHSANGLRIILRLLETYFQDQDIYIQ